MKCDICKRSFPKADILTIDGHPICLACKPKAVQCIREGIDLKTLFNRKEFQEKIQLKVDGSLIYAPLTCELPNRCFKCNKESNGKKFSIILQWQEDSDLKYFKSKTNAYVDYYLCSKHDHVRKMMSFASSWALILSIPVMILTVIVFNSGLPEVFGLISLSLILFLIIVGLLSDKDFRIKAAKIDKKAVWLEGAGQDYLNSIKQGQH